MTRAYAGSMGTLDQQLALEGCVLRYSDSGGPGRAVLLLHGAGADHVMFDAQAERLRAAGARVVVVDLRGHGASRPTTAPQSAARFVADAEALIGHLDLQQPALVGHSLGGNIAQALVRGHPERFAGVVVIDSTWSAGPLTAVERWLLRSASPLLRLIPARSFARVMANASAVTDAARRDAERAFSAMTKAEFIDVWRAVTEFVDPDPTYRTPIPLLLIRGADDRTGNIATAMAAWAKADGVREVVIPNAGHIVTQDAPDAVSDALVEFVGSL